MTQETNSEKWREALDSMNVKGIVLTDINKNLSYDEAMKELLSGKKVKLPEWDGYWFKEEINQVASIKVFTASGDVLDTPFLEDYKKRTDWQITDGSRDFGGALKALKAGKKVSRKGWNGTDMYVVLMPGYTEGIPCNENTAKAHNVPVGTILKFRPYMQLKTAQNDIAMWSPSGSDSLAEDWYVL